LGSGGLYPVPIPLSCQNRPSPGGPGGHLPSVPVCPGSEDDGLWCTLPGGAKRPFSTAMISSWRGRGNV
ncbi:MAG: hypothetical protein CO103_07940, partial [Chloroflexi bacterium CG_4_9_14_3_um_filter_45_9]